MRYSRVIKRRLIISAKAKRFRSPRLVLSYEVEMTEKRNCFSEVYGYLACVCSVFSFKNNAGFIHDDIVPCSHWNLNPILTLCGT